MSDYYEISILCTGSCDGKKFSLFDEETKIVDTSDEAINYLKDRYKNIIRRQLAYFEPDKPVGYMYEFENADLSHTPVEKWIQRDWVNVSKIHSEIAFEEIKYDIS